MKLVQFLLFGLILWSGPAFAQTDDDFEAMLKAMSQGLNDAGADKETDAIIQ